MLARSTGSDAGFDSSRSRGFSTGAAAPVPAVLREGPGCGVDQVEGDDLNLGRVSPSAPRAGVPLSNSSNSKPTDAGRVSSRSYLVRGRKMQWEERPMAIVRNIEVIAQSPNGFDDACREAIREASKTLRGISSFPIKNAEVVVENDQITMFRVNGKISFLVEDR